MNQNKLAIGATPSFEPPSSYINAHVRRCRAAVGHGMLLRSFFKFRTPEPRHYHISALSFPPFSPPTMFGVESSCGVDGAIDLLSFPATLPPAVALYRTLPQCTEHPVHLVR